MSVVEEIYEQNRKRKLSLVNRRKRPVISLESSFRRAMDSHREGIMIEFKRKSPSGFKGGSISGIESFKALAGMGADAISVLTEPEQFMGSMEDGVMLQDLSIPMLMKDFVCSREMILSGYMHGFDAFLLIADFLDESEIDDLSTYGISLGMDVLIEFHGIESLSRIPEGKGIITGYNRRNLRTLTMEPRELEALQAMSGRKGIRILESGIDRENYQGLTGIGYDGFLVGASILNEPQFFKEIKEGGRNYVGGKNA